MTRYYLLAVLLWSVNALGNAATLAIIIDDVGYNAHAGQQLIDLDHAITLAVLPFTPHGKMLARTGSHQGKEIMLHAPMSATQSRYNSQYTLTGNMDTRQLQTLLKRMLADVPEARGVNNHMGSQLTREAEPMQSLMQVLAEQQLYFVDSRTTDKTRALDAARTHGLPAMKRDIFLDNSRDEKAITRQLQQAILLAQRQGYAIAIGHPYAETISVLQQLDTLLKNSGVILVPASVLIEQHAPAATYRPKPLPPAWCVAPPRLLWHIDSQLSQLWQAEQQRLALHAMLYPKNVILVKP